MVSFAKIALVVCLFAAMKVTNSNFRSLFTVSLALTPLKHLSLKLSCLYFLGNAYREEKLSLLISLDQLTFDRIVESLEHSLPLAFRAEKVLVFSLQHNYFLFDYY